MKSETHWLQLAASGSIHGDGYSDVTQHDLSPLLRVFH